MSSLNVPKKIHEKNDEIADNNRRFFEENRIAVFNLISSPGSGKTSLLEKLAGHLKEKMVVITGDIQTELDAGRIKKAGCHSVQIETKGACHLNALMVQDCLPSIEWENVNYLFIENVGNLVCPSSYYLGEHQKIAVLSVTEGEEKPVKYPALFVRSKAVIFSKLDLIPYVSFNLKQAESDCLKLNPEVSFFHMSIKNNEGIAEFINYLKDSRQKLYFQTF